MTREEIIKWLESLKAEIGRSEHRILWHYAEAIDMAIEALSEDISEDGTLKVKVKDGSKVNRVLVWGDNIFGGLYYPDDGNVQNMHNGMDMEQAIEWCKDCQHNEVCRYYPYDGCQFKDSSERPRGEWVFHVNFSDESQRDDYDLICTNCGELYRCDCQDDVNDFVWNAHYCMNCGAYMGGDNGKQKHL